MDMNYYTDPGNFSGLIRYCLINGVKWTILYLVFFFLYHRFNLHEKLGFFKTSEPESHYKTSLQNWKFPFLWGVGITISSYLIGLNLHTFPSGQRPHWFFELPEQFIFLHSPNFKTDVLFAIVGFYLIDLTDYWAHRFNHVKFFYKKFPFSHFVHHNCVYLNPLVVVSSPFVHFAALTGMLMYALLLSQGLVKSVAMIHVVKSFSNFFSHLGFDPLPWLSRINHRVGGWIPWIPLHHQYHHLPFVKPGNYGNVTCLWDYVFRTVVPESVHHIETGQPLPQIAAKMEQGEQEMRRFLKGKNRLSLS